jgi:hypothetical protein
VTWPTANMNRTKAAWLRFAADCWRRFVVELCLSVPFCVSRGSAEMRMKSRVSKNRSVTWSDVRVFAAESSVAVSESR